MEIRYDTNSSDSFNLSYDICGPTFLQVPSHKNSNSYLKLVLHLLFDLQNGGKTQKQMTCLILSYHLRPYSMCLECI